MHTFIGTCVTQANYPGKGVDDRSALVPSCLAHLPCPHWLSWVTGLSNLTPIYLWASQLLLRSSARQITIPFSETDDALQEEHLQPWPHSLPWHWKAEAIPARIRWPVRSRWKSQTIHIPHVAVLLILSLLTSTGSGKVVLGQWGRVASLLTLHSDVRRKWVPSRLSWVTNLSQSHLYIRRSWEEHPRCSASQQFTLFLEAMGKCSFFQVSFYIFIVV